MSTQQEISGDSMKNNATPESPAQTKRSPSQQLRHRRIQVGRVLVVCKMVLFLLFLSRRDVPSHVLWVIATPFLVVWGSCAVMWLSLGSKERSK